MDPHLKFAQTPPLARPLNFPKSKAEGETPLRSGPLKGKASTFQILLCLPLDFKQKIAYNIFKR